MTDLCVYCGQAEGHTPRCSVTKFNVREYRMPVPCPDAAVCQTCPCASEDDACFPGERLRAERDLLVIERQEAAAARDHYWQALVDIAGLENWQRTAATDIARKALDKPLT